LHVVPAARGTELFNTGDFIREPHAACALDTSVHGRLDKGTEILVFDGAFTSDFVETCAVCTVAHRLVLKVAFSTLVTNGAIEGMVGEKKFHDTLSGLLSRSE
jgi:hypothetical protein